MDLLLGDFVQAAFWIAVGKIIVVNVVLSGDNAVVIALACMHLPPRQRLWGMVLGAGVAILLRILFTLVVAQAMGCPYLKLAGGLLLLWVAIKLVAEDAGEGEVRRATNLWNAVWIVTVADIATSLDNVIAIAAAAETAAEQVDQANALSIKALLIVFGLATSVPLIIAGSALLVALLRRFPILIWAGGGLLGWVAGDIIGKDVALTRFVSAEIMDKVHGWSAVAGALFVIGVGYLIVRSRRAAHEDV